MRATSTAIDGAGAAGSFPPGVDRIGRRPGSRQRLATAVVIAVALLTSACSSGDDGKTGTASSTPTSVDAVAEAQARVVAAKSGVTDAQSALTESGKQACGVAAAYVDALDRYGKLFTDKAATVGDVKTAGADLVAPRESVSSAATDVDAAKTALAQAEQELIDAEAALVVATATESGGPTPTTTPATATATTLVPPTTIQRVQQAEADLAQTAQGITDATPLTEATSEYNSAALALQIAWLRLLNDAGCLTDAQQAQAVDLVTTYTTTLQTELQQAGYFDGPVDGIYGPQTVQGVKQLQADSGLPQTGFVDIATARALDAKLAALGQQAAAADQTHTAAVQTVLKLAGFWPGDIDGTWTDELTTAMQAFQTKLGVDPTGVVDAATLAAFELGLIELSSPPSTETATATETATETATALATETETAKATATVTKTAPPVTVTKTDPPVTVTVNDTPTSTSESKEATG